jgi:hypothetical protein
MFACYRMRKCPDRIDALEEEGLYQHGRESDLFRASGP